MKNQHTELFSRELMDTSPQTVTARVVFGNPNSNCSGTGICQISINDCFPGEPAPPDCPCLRVVTACIRRVRPGTIRIVIAREQIDAELRPLFQDDRFEIPSGGYYLQKSIQKKLALKEAFVPAGTYEVKQLGRSLAIDLPLRKKEGAIIENRVNEPDG